MSDERDSTTADTYGAPAAAADNDPIGLGPAPQDPTLSGPPEPVSHEPGDGAAAPASEAESVAYEPDPAAAYEPEPVAYEPEPAAYEPAAHGADAPADAVTEPAVELPPAQAPPAGPPPLPPDESGDGDFGDGRPRPRIYKLRLLAIVFGLGLIAFVSTVFGIMMAVSSDLPALENEEQYKSAKNSVLLDVRRKPLGILTDKNNRIIVESNQISASMKNAIISIEDKRFYEHNGVDYRGIARALWQDVRSQSAVQGGSTIPQQFVKNALEAQGERTVLQKLREAALAYHLTRKWSKAKILKEYLNQAYFGNGAYGVESAARVYWSTTHPGCESDTERPCAFQLTPSEAAMLAGVVASPSRYDPVAHPSAGKKRRDQVLGNMYDQGYLTEMEYKAAVNDPLPTEADLSFPDEKTEAPYFTTWVKQQVVDKFGAQRAFGGGLEITTTLDLELQQAARNAVDSELPNRDGPRAALVVIDNYTGEVRAMVGGDDYNEKPFNLATNGQRQPGSSFKPFVLAAALREGISPGSVWASNKKQFVVPNSGGKEFFVVNNYEGNYSGAISLAGATSVSDNSVYAEVAIKTGIKKVAAMARDMGIRTPVSENYAISLGGLKQGVTPLDMAHAYETFATGGLRVTGTLGTAKEGPVGIKRVERGSKVWENKRVTRRIFSKKLSDTATEMLRNVVLSGTGKSAQIGVFAAGKTGTTENYGDAWFVGFTEKYSAAVWVGYPDNVTPMKTEYAGGPVAGGTYPAEIWQRFMSQALQIDAQREAEKAAREGKPPPEAPSTGVPAPAAPTATETQPAPEPETGGDTAPPTETAPQAGPAPQNTPQVAPAQPPAPEPEPAPAPAAPPPAAPPAGPPPAAGGGGGAAAPAA